MRSFFRFESSASRRFLLETSVLDWDERISLRVIDRDRENSQAALSMLARSDLLLAPSDTRPGWFRYHEAFRSFLQQELRESGTTAESVLFGRAADWHFAHGEVEVAVGYLVAGRLWDRVLESVQRSGYALHRQALNWLDACRQVLLTDASR